MTQTIPEEQRVELIAAAQAQRDRERIATYWAEVLALRHRVAELERSPSRRALAPVRRAVHGLMRLTSSVRGSLRPAAAAPPVAAVATAVARSRGLVLVIDNEWPQPTRDSGSIDICNLLGALKRLGFDTILAAAKQHEGEQPARDRLVAEGVRCLQPGDAASVEDFILRHGPGIDLCMLCRVYGGGEFLELVQQHCRNARFVFNSIDLNYLREERKAQLFNDQALLSLIQMVRDREEHVIRACDATMVVSKAELDLLAETMPDCLAVQMPLARAVQAPATPFAPRRGIGFIGGFAHTPNVDAMRFFLSEIWPLVRRELPDCDLTIVGADAPADLGQGSDGVRLLGHVPDVAPWFESLRLTVAPLRFGAGAKGKVASSLAAGVPCVATSIASEGMSLAEDGGVLVADSPAAFAAAIIRAYGDRILWERLSAASLAYAGSTLSVTAWQTRLDGMLRRIGL